MKIQFRPLTIWPRSLTKKRRNSAFTASYSDTLTQLEYEIAKLGARETTIQTGMAEGDIRLDGWPRADARKPNHPGVIVAFEARLGPLSFACDEFVDWKDNLRGIALTLERLRMADLYGVTKSGEQYTGWKALPQTTEAPDDKSFSSREQATKWLWRASGFAFNLDRPDKDALIRACRHVARISHPDAVGGDAAEFRRLQSAKEMLGL